MDFEPEKMSEGFSFPFDPLGHDDHCSRGTARRASSFSKAQGRSIFRTRVEEEVRGLG
jgi:hypothetical protein